MRKAPIDIVTVILGLFLGIFLFVCFAVPAIALAVTERDPLAFGIAFLAICLAVVPIGPAVYEILRSWRR